MPPEAVPSETQLPLPQSVIPEGAPAERSNANQDPAPAPSPELTTDPGASSAAKVPNCERTYNGRNCCETDSKCLKAQQAVAQYKLSSIGLDITPTFTSDLESGNAEPTEVRKESNLAKTPSRTWKNRAGATVAEGRFIDYRNGLVYVLDDRGEKVELPYTELSDDDICFVTAWWSLPSECSLADEAFQQRNWIASTLTWKASALCHKPLYFEEVALERYGHSVGPIKQPFVSGRISLAAWQPCPIKWGFTHRTNASMPWGITVRAAVPRGWCRHFRSASEVG